MGTKKYLEIINNSHGLVEFYRNNPCIAAKELLGVDLAPIQQVVLQDMWFKNYSLVVATRGFGKTFISGLSAALSAILYPGNRIGLIGPSFRQGKLLFAEVEKLYNKSPIFRQACIKRPIKGTDSCYIQFKTVRNIPGSYIEALPLGDGGKIRGSRYYVIHIDELPQLSEKIIDMVIRPMGATSANPMEKVREKDRQRKLIQAGLAVESDFEVSRVNKMIMTTSGYYKFNHMWNRMREYWKIESEELSKGIPTTHCVWQIPYWDLPEGFLDNTNIENAKRTMSASEFSMEYEAAMISESEGFFKASSIENCSLNTDFQCEYFGSPSSEYVMGVDPNQGGNDACGIVLFKLIGDNSCKVIYATELVADTVQDIVLKIYELCEKFNVVRIKMDRGGGGKAVLDLLEDGYQNYTPILERDSDTNIDKQGVRILDMVVFSPVWLADINFSLKAGLENKKLLFPEVPTSSSEDLIDVYEDIEKLKRQITSIVVTQTASGVLHFDTPTKHRRKDLYSAALLAYNGVQTLNEISTEQIIFGTAGLIRRHDGGAKFEYFNSSNKLTIPISSHAAVLKPRRKKR